jgi:hypothetical protein
VLLVQDRHPGETFRAGRAHKPLSHPVGLRRAKRRANDRDPVASKHLVKSVRKFLVPITNQKTDAFWALPRVHVTCRACCVTHGALGLGVHPARCTRRLPSSMKNST